MSFPNDLLCDVSSRAQSLSFLCNFIQDRYVSFVMISVSRATAEESITDAMLLTL